MKTYHLWKSGSLFCALALLVASPVSAQNLTRYLARPGSKVKIEGTSTLHDWAMEGRLIRGYFELDSNVKIDTSQSNLPGSTDGKVNAKAEVSIPVRSIKSDKPSMDSVMQQAMQEEKHPLIEYRLTEMTFKPPHSPGTPFQFDTKGGLTIAGVRRQITMPVTIDRLENNRLKITASTSLKMTDYGVTPPAPKLALGAIRTGDEVKLSFEWITAPGDQAPKATEKTP